MKAPATFRWLLVGLLFPVAAWAGPPFVTDDPEPVDYRHWEIILGSQTAHSPEAIVGTLPHLEVNYGLVPDLQFHVIVPDAFDSTAGAPRQFGLGDIELGAKWRFVGQTGDRPEIAVFPLVELPTGSADRGLGSGHAQVFLPIWVQKDFGSWTTYGGGGYWINPGANNRDFWFVGWLVQRQLTKTLALGAEVYHETAQTLGGAPASQVNAGITWDLNDVEHILASAGPAIQGPRGYQTYLAFQLTFGPASPSGGPSK